ncbi:MAG: hypothetical protein QXW97_03005 [Candidatus Pacearchaeota archaeon]
MIKILLYIIAIIGAFFSGIILSNVCKDEIKAWKKRFFIFFVICFISCVLIVFFNFPYKIPVILSLFFMMIVFLTVIWKSYVSYKR